jgi:ABC-2 type transport system ATP-binding protein
VEALAEVNLEVRPGTVSALLGANGAGKTTLLKVLATLLRPSSGTALIQGADVARQPAQARANLGFCGSVERSFYHRLSGRENLWFFGRLQNIPRSALRSRIEECLALLHLSEQADVRFSRYSTGMQQRLGLARALLHSPSVLLLDEPTRSLDPYNAEEYRRLVRELLVGQLNMTVLLATHNLEEAEQVADRLVFLHQGRIKCEGATGDLLAQGGGELKSVFFRLLGEDAPERLRRIPR